MSDTINRKECSYSEKPNSSDLIYRQDALEALRTCYETERIDYTNGNEYINYEQAVHEVEQLSFAQPERRWIPTSEKLPDELAEVNVTWKNTEPEPYYNFIKGHCFTGTAVYFRGRWYWYSAVCVDYLKEYGFSPNDEMDDAIKVLAWMPLPEPYREEGDS